MFKRWFWLVYAPVGLLVLSFLLKLIGLFPHRAQPLLVVLIVWSLISGRLWFERRRRGVFVPPPRSLMVFMGALLASGLLGTLIAWIGVRSLAHPIGGKLALLGLFMMLVAVTIPFFKVVDSAGRVAIRALRILWPFARKTAKKRRRKTS
jgi:hypothetical protein